MDIVEFPDSRLRTKCSPVTEITGEIRAILDDMAETMYCAPGIGLAAPQVGVGQRIIVVDVGSNSDADRPHKLYKLINPEILSVEGSTETEEGCLSIPGIREVVKRPAAVVVKALDPEGKELRIDADGLLAVCLQHEIDHLDGVLFIDHLSRLKQKLVKAKYQKLLRDSEDEPD